MSPLEIATAGWYNLLYVLAIVVAAMVLRDEGSRRGWHSGAWAIGILVWVTGGVIGAMLPRLLLGDLVAAKTCLGAIAGATLSLVLAARALRIPIADALDATAIAIPLGGAVVRIGCFLAGCCEGTITGLPVGISLDPDVAPRHPVQLYEATLEAALAFVLTQRPRYLRAPGKAFLFSVACLGLIRFATEFVRTSETIGPLSLAQWVVAPVIAGCAILLVLYPRSDEACSPPPHQGIDRAWLTVAATVFGAILFVPFLSPLEVAVLVMAGVAGLLLLARRVKGAYVGMSVLALQMPPISTDSTYPRTYQSLGGGLTLGRFDLLHTAEDCDGNEVERWKRTHSVFGMTGELGVRTQGSRTRGAGVRARGYYGEDHAGRAVVTRGAPSVPGPYTNRNVGLSLVADVDWKYLGLSLGATAGNITPIFDQEESGFAGSSAAPQPVAMLPAVGIRIGRMDNLSLEVRFADEAANWIPAPIGTFSVGFGDSLGNRIRFGVSETGAFIGGRRMNPSGLEIVPAVGLSLGESSSVQGSVLIRRWFRVERQPRAGR